jgi:hypothetical protein
MGRRKNQFKPDDGYYWRCRIYDEEITEEQIELL